MKLSLMHGARAKPRHDHRFVDAGRVACPRKAADIDVELCLSCPWLKQAGLSQEPAWIRCTPSADLMQPPFSGMLTTGRERR